jgi:threonylcarbamoyladenosine tRNA methylthiotransferase MtaB
MTRVYATFLGCKVSQADSEAALARLAAAGLEPVADREAADVCLLLTCCVTGEAERKSRRLARRLARDGRRVIVAGCAATLRAAQFDGPGIEVLAGSDWTTLADRVAGSGGQVPAPVPAVPAPAVRDRLRFTLKVQDGCAGRCSYCAVRLVRGRPRSTPLADAVAAAREALAAGCGEIVLSGVDLGAYRDAAGTGTSPSGGSDLVDLVRALTGLPGLLRLRLSSVEPQHLDERLLGALAHPLVARHLHVPLQSADDDVLAAMRRRYDWARYSDAVERARASLGGVALSTDVIAGFPTEDDNAFARTLAVLESGLFERVHVFAYSARPGTEAASLAPRPAAVIRARAAAAGVAARAARRRAAAAALGCRAEVLVEDKRDGLWRGYSSQYVRYHLEGSLRPGLLVDAVGEGLVADGVKGRAVGEAAAATRPLPGRRAGGPSNDAGTASR